MIIVAEDSSERTKRRFIELSKESQIPILITEKIDTISKSIGKNNKAIIGIKESNFAEAIQKIYHGGDTNGED